MLQSKEFKMGKLLRKTLDTIAWIALIIGIILLIWKIFGNSPTGFEIITPFIVFGLTKIWSNNEKINDIDYKVSLSSRNTKHSFEKVREDIHYLKNKLDNLSNKI